MLCSNDSRDEGTRKQMRRRSKNRITGSSSGTMICVCVCVCECVFCLCVSNTLKTYVIAIDGSDLTYYSEIVGSNVSAPALTTCPLEIAYLHTITFVLTPRFCIINSLRGLCVCRVCVCVCAWMTLCLPQSFFFPKHWRIPVGNLLKLLSANMKTWLSDTNCTVLLVSEGHVPSCCAKYTNGSNRATTKTSSSRPPPVTGSSESRSNNNVSNNTAGDSATQTPTKVAINGNGKGRAGRGSGGGSMGKVVQTPAGFPSRLTVFGPDGTTEISKHRRGRWVLVAAPPPHDGGAGNLHRSGQRHGAKADNGMPTGISAVTSVAECDGSTCNRCPGLHIRCDLVTARAVWDIISKKKVMNVSTLPQSKTSGRSLAALSILP